MLLYTAELKLDMRMPFLDKCRKVQAVIEQLALNTCRDVRIGSALTRGISGACVFLSIAQTAYLILQRWRVPCSPSSALSVCMQHFSLVCAGEAHTSPGSAAPHIMLCLPGNLICVQRNKMVYLPRRCCMPMLCH